MFFFSICLLWLAHKIHRNSMLDGGIPAEQGRGECRQRGALIRAVITPIFKAPPLDQVISSGGLTGFLGRGHIQGRSDTSSPK